jgi:hypothetical protein
MTKFLQLIISPQLLQLFLVPKFKAPRAIQAAIGWIQAFTQTQPLERTKALRLIHHLYRFFRPAIGEF